MIYTVTFNPSLDYIVSVDNFVMGMTNRTSSEIILPGGKGINVSIVLKNLGLDSTALGFTAGFTGQEIKRRVSEFGVETRFIEIEDGVSRINVKIKNVDGTEINGAGPAISQEKIDELYATLDDMVNGDFLVLAGSIPKSMSEHLYEEIIERLMDKKVSVVVDATGQLLLNVLRYRPFLIKPNHHELGELFNVTINSKEEVVSYAKRLQAQGARNVLVSMGSQGAVFIAESGEILYGEAPDGVVVNSVGAGDSMVAGFIAGWLKSEKYEEAFSLGLAAGSASAFSENLATNQETELVKERVVVERK